MWLRKYTASCICALAIHLLKACEPLLCGCTSIQLVAFVCLVHITLHVCHVACLEVWGGLGGREPLSCKCTSIQLVAGLQTNVLGGWWGAVFVFLACNTMPL